MKLIEPAFGGINLEDIAQPKCFRILDALREELAIPVWHDDQQGTATVLLAGLMNALRIVDKDLESVRIAMVGAGAANVAAFRLLTAAGVDAEGIVVCDSRGVLHSKRDDLEAAQEEYSDKWRICQQSNADNVTGGIAEVEVEARDVRGLFRALEHRFPELEGRLREGVAVSIDGEIVHEPLLEPIEPQSEIHFLPSISGG